MENIKTETENTTEEAVVATPAQEVQTEIKPETQKTPEIPQEAKPTVHYNVYQKLGMIQANLKAPKGQYNSYGKFNYRSAEDILQAVKPFLQQYGCLILIDDKIKEFGNRLFIEAEIKFLSTDSPETAIVSHGDAEICEHKGMTLDQCTGTASSYARKYGLNALLLLDDTKDSDTDEMKRIEQTESQSTNTGWGKKNSDSQASAQQSGGWVKKASTTSSTGGFGKTPAQNNGRAWGQKK